MPSTINTLLTAAGLKAGGVVRWGERVPSREPGAYMVAMTADPDSPGGNLTECPISQEAVEELLRVRPELRLDGERPNAEALAARLAHWLPDETILYIGLAGTSLQKRVAQYYRTPLGARRPHAGGYFLKLLRIRTPVLAERSVSACHEAGMPRPAPSAPRRLSLTGDR